MFDWYLIRMVLMYISFSSFPFFYSSDLSSTVHVKESRDDMDMAFNEISDFLPQSTPLYSPLTQQYNHSSCFCSLRSLVSFFSLPCLLLSSSSSSHPRLGCGKKDTQCRMWHESERNEMTKSLKAIYEWGISFSIKFIWTLWEWILVLKKFSSRLPFSISRCSLFFLILPLRKQ